MYRFVYFLTLLFVCVYDEGTMLKSLAPINILLIPTSVDKLKTNINVFDNTASYQRRTHFFVNID